MNKVCKYIIGTVLAIVCGEALASPVRIMPMGDSITFGDGSSMTNSYRGTLKTLLDNGGYTNIDFVGSTNSGNFADNEHEGWQGYRMAGSPKSILENAYSWLIENPADIVLLNAGINDFIQNDPPSTNEVSQVLDEIYQANSNATIVLSLILNGIRTPNSYPTLPAFNDLVNSMAMKRIANGDDIIIVDMETGAGFDYSNQSPDFYLHNPYVHPSDAGYDKMATNWYSSVVLALQHQSGLPYFFSQAITNAETLSAYNYKAGANGSPAPAFSLASAPTGMTVNVASGLVEWTPATDQQGMHAVTLLASNSVGVATQSFDVVVSGNTLPVITSEAVTNAVVEQPYTYDAEASSIPSAQFLLDLSPSNMTVNATNGLVEWTPSAAQFGTHSVTLLASNVVGVATQNFEVVVAGTLPVITSEAVTNVVAEQLYSYDAEASGIPMAGFILNLAPSNMTINATNGLVEWTPSVAQFGTNSVTLLASNVVGVATQTFDIVVSGTLPVITSEAITNVVAEQLYSYDAEASGIPSAQFQLDLAPSNMTVNATNGLVEWTPVAEQYGTHSVTLLASNVVGVATQSFDIVVAGTLPIITSEAVTNVVAEQFYSYDAEATGIPMAGFILELAPSNMTVNATNGLVEWTPVAEQYGTHSVTLLASNVVGVATQTFDIVVSGTLPVITSEAVTNVVAEQLYSYDAEATGIPSAQFQLDLAPSNMTVNATNGLVEWTPVAEQYGTHSVTLLASNVVGVATQSFDIVVSSTTPEISVFGAFQDQDSVPVDVFNPTNKTLMGTVIVNLTASDMVFGISTASVSVVHQTTSTELSATLFSQISTNGSVEFAWSVIVPADAYLGVYDVTLTASNGVGNAAVSMASMEVAEPTVNTSLAFQYASAGNLQLPVSLSALSDQMTELVTWTQQVEFVDGVATNIILSDLPTETAFMRVKLEKSLSRVLPVVQFNEIVQVTADFSGANTLLSGDLNDDNAINTGDYFALRANWQTSNPAGDANYDGSVNTSDYFALRANWQKSGE